VLVASPSVYILSVFLKEKFYCHRESSGSGSAGLFENREENDARMVAVSPG